MKNIQSRQRGFTFVELMVVLAIIAVLTALAVPKVKEVLYANEAPKIGEVAQTVIQKTRITRMSGDTWSTAADQELGTMLQADGRVTITGTGAGQQVSHGIGSSGLIHFAPGTITTANDAGQLTFTNVDQSACSALMNTVAKYVDVITVNGTSVKALGGNFIGSAAQNACTSGSTNSIVFLYK
jgi:prepilin-type N-terminal cleavage/methylation domain-containing protein